MAKIYETREDVLRDDLTKKVKSHSTDSKISFWSGLVVLIVGMDGLNKKARPEWVEKSNLWRRVDKSLGWIGIVLGAVSLGFAALSHKWKKDSQKMLDSLGPEAVKMPGQLEPYKSPEDFSNAVSDTGKYAARLQQEASGEKTRTL